jgi:hypothetical protein
MPWETLAAEIREADPDCCAGSEPADRKIMA